MLIWNTYTKKCVDDHHVYGMTFYKKIIIINCKDNMRYFKMVSHQASSSVAKQVKTVGAAFAPLQSAPQQNSNLQRNLV